jgi:hypothetical protein
MATRTIQHGTNAGYRAELETDSVCDRCRNAHRQYAKQFTRTGKAKGIKYGHFEVIDHLYKGPGQSKSRPGSTYVPGTPARVPVERHRDAASGPAGQDTVPSDGQADPSLADRLSAAIGRIAGPSPSNDYVETDEGPSYISASDPDPEPNDNEGWSVVSDEDVVITKQGLQKIEDNLGTYLSVVGITFEMIDPYCGPILAENFDNIISRWTKVIARYPRAAKLFLSEDGGTIFTWIGAIQATWPVLLAIYKHHLARTIRTDDQGNIVQVHPNGSQPTVDATTPPMHNYEYAVQ